MAGTRSKLEIFMFGPFEAWCNGQRLPDKAWGRKKTKDLCKILLSERGRAFTQDQLIDLLYPEADPDKVAKNLRGRISELRKALEPGLGRGPDSAYVRHVGQGYAFSAEADCWVDVEAFERLMNKAHTLAETQRWAQALDAYAGAVALYRGDFLADDAYEEWALDLRQRWRQRYLDGLEGLAGCQVQQGNLREALANCGRALQLEPYRESAYQLKMRLHHQAGQRQQALETFDACAQALKDHLGVGPSPQTRSLQLQIRKGQFPEVPRAVPHNLAVPPTPLVGRAGELTEVAARLGEAGCRVLSLVGAGGVGKSRLALAAAQQQLEVFPDGVFWVPLAPLQDGQLLPVAVAEVLRFSFYGNESPLAQLGAYLRSRQMLLVLDNFEHLAPQATVLAELLGAAPGVKALTTSRVRLNLKGEHVLDLDGLPCPPPQTEVADAEAVQLFVQVARRTDPAFALSGARKAVVAEVCRLVQGNPLAIELAAGWVGVLGCAEILAEIQSNLDFLAQQIQDLPERHRSLRATFEHSWALLSEAERGVAARLSVFFGGFARDAADGVAGASLRALQNLVAQSLVRRSGARRYEMHELLRQFAAEKLTQDASEVRGARDRHAAHFARLLADSVQGLKGGRQQATLHAIAQEIDNVRAAWGHLCDQGRWDALEAGYEAVYLFHEMRGRFHGGEGLFAQALRRLDKPKGTNERHLRGRLLACQARFLFHLNQLERARACVGEALALSGGGDTTGVAFCRWVLGQIEENEGNYDDAQGLAQQALATYEAGDLPYEVIQARISLGVLAFDLGDYEEAKRHYAAAIARCRQVDNRFGLAKCLVNVGNVLYAQDAHERAKAHYEESLPLLRELDVRWGEQIVLNNLGGVCHSLGEADTALEYFHQSLSVSQGIGYESGSVMALTNLSDVEHGLGRHREARAHMREAFGQAVKTGVPWLVLDCVVYFAKQLCKKPSTQEAAYGLLCYLAEHHPMDYMRTNAANMAKDIAQRLSARVRKELRKTALAASTAEVIERATELLECAEI